MSNIPEKLYCVTIEDLSVGGELAGEMLSALELNFSCRIDRENNTVFHTVYGETPEAAALAEKRIRAAAREWKEFGLEIGRIDRCELEGADWSQAWKKYFHPIEISERLLVSPSWIEHPEKPGRKVLVIDPGMSFGTGQHATTFYCLKVIDRLAAEQKAASLLDAGCGSGILAIAGALRGYAPIDAFDFDPDAIRVAEENIGLNQVSGIALGTGDAADYSGRPEKYDLVCANILGHLLKAYRSNIAGWVKPGKYLALAGILSSEFDSVSAAYGELGFQELERETLREWTSGLFLNTATDR